MKHRNSKRKTSNKKHDSSVQVKVTEAENEEESEALAESVKDTSENIYYWREQIGNQLRKFLTDQDIPSDTRIPHKTKSGEQVNLQELIREDYLHVSGAYEAGQALACLFNAFDDFRKIGAFINNVEASSNEKNQAAQQLEALMLRLFKLANNANLITKSSLEDFTLAGRSRTTEAHEEKTENSKRKRKIAENWYKECRKLGKNKTQCYKICSRKFKENGETVAWETIKGYFKGRKDLP